MKKAATALLVLLALLVCAVPRASADLGMTMTMTMNAGGMAITSEMQTRIKASKMPADALEKTCRFELKKEVKYPVDEAILVVRVLKELEGRGEDGKAQKRVRVMFAAMNAASSKINGFQRAIPNARTARNVRIARGYRAKIV